MDTNVDPSTDMDANMDADIILAHFLKSHMLNYSDRLGRDPDRVHDRSKT